MKKSENHKKRATKSCCGLAIVISFLTILTFGCRAQQTAPEKKPYQIPAAAPSAEVRTETTKPVKETPTPVKKDSEQNTNSAKSEEPDQISAKVAKSGDLGYLREWVGKYSFSGSTKKQKSFFSLPEIKTPLQKLLGKVKFKKLIDGFTGAVPIEEQGNYLILEGTSDKADEHLIHSLVTVNLKNGNLAVAFVTSNYPADSTFESYGNFEELPAAVQKRIMDYK